MDQIKLAGRGLATLLAIAAILVGCGDPEAEGGPTCGTGTEREGGDCVLAIDPVECGEGEET